MLEILSKVISAVFVLLIYYFIFIIVKMIYTDINVMKRKKAGLPEYEAYLKPVNLAHGAHFKLEERYPLYGDDVIGRGKKCDIYINDNFMSHNHSRIFKEAGGFFLEDLGSTNGTLLNGNEVKDEAFELLDGDKICIGQVEFMFLRPEAEK